MFLAVMASVAVAVAAAAAVRCPGGVYSGASEECPADLGHMGEGLPSTCCFGFAMMLGVEFQALHTARQALCSWESHPQSLQVSSLAGFPHLSLPDRPGPRVAWCSHTLYPC